MPEASAGLERIYSAAARSAGFSAGRFSFSFTNAFAMMISPLLFYSKYKTKFQKPGLKLKIKFHGVC
jgi:hypothetical protein